MMVGMLFDAASLLWDIWGLAVIPHIFKEGRR